MKIHGKFSLKSLLPDVVAVLIFVMIAVIYCSPMLDGKVISAGDSISGKGMANEIKEYYDATGSRSFWTGSMFSGMPTYQISSHVPSAEMIYPVSRLYRLMLPGTIALVFIYLIGFYILLRAFSLHKWLSLIGSVAISFSSYFFIIIAAGHNHKVYGIAYLAPIIAGFILMFKKKYGWGIVLTMLFSAIGLMFHPQMTYYYFLMIGLMFLAEVFIHLKEKRIRDLVIASVLFAGSLGVGMGTGYAKMQANREYVKETMRGGHSELVKESDASEKTGGLDLSYATQWSYGIGETWTILIPNLKGGSSHYDVGTNSLVYQRLRDNGVPAKDAADFCKNVPAYWGDQPFTSGPVYVGSIIFFLFILGILVVKGPYKWALLVATAFSVMLSWGKNFLPLTELFFNYLPMYDKFRAVSSILVVAEVTIPLLGLLAIKAFMDKQVSREKMQKSLYLAAGITVGISLIFALFGSVIFDFRSASDDRLIAQLPDWLYESIVAERAAMLRNDAWRSIAFVVLGAGTLWLFLKGKLKLAYFAAALGVLIIADMWPVNKRFLNDDNFVTPGKYKSIFAIQPYEESILKDTDPHFRVLNLTTNTFNESRTSYYLKSIGGYHAAKLRRYQDLIDEHISKTNLDVLSMLNTKYVITKGQNGEALPQRNPDAMGNAWFVDSLMIVDTPNEESDALNNINLRNTAVLDRKFQDFTQGFMPGKDTAAQVKLLSYAPDVLNYEYSASKPGIIVFSEIFYPYGWKASIDDEPLEHFRVNYTLRALNVPAGKHKIKFEFKPDSIFKGKYVSYAFIFIMYASILAIVVYSLMAQRKERKIGKV